MVLECINWDKNLPMFTDLLEIYNNGDAIHMIEVLTDVLTNDQNLHQKDRQSIADLIRLLAAIARQRDEDLSKELHLLKIPA